LALPPSARESEPKIRHVSQGQLVYVPCYSHIYLLDGRPYNLAITLSLRNTSIKGNMVIQSVDYHNSAGSLIKSLVSKEIELGPLAVAEFFVKEEDKSAGSGACFLVRWVAEKEVSDPIVEAVMVGASGSLGVSFVTSGKVLEELPYQSPLKK